MICNSGFLLTRKIKELVTGGAGESQQVTTSALSFKKSAPVTTLNVKPISSESVIRGVSNNGPHNNLFKTKSEAKLVISEPFYPNNKDKLSTSFSFPNPNKIDNTVFENKSAVRDYSPRSKNDFSFNSDNGGYCSYTNYNEKVKNLSLESHSEHSSLPLIPNFLKSPDNSPYKSEALPPALAPLPSTEEELLCKRNHQRKKKKPCTNETCYSVHHNIAENQTHFSYDYNSLKNPTVNERKKRHNKPSVLQKFYSLDRGNKESKLTIKGSGANFRKQCETIKGIPEPKNNSSVSSSLASHSSLNDQSSDSLRRFENASDEQYFSERKEDGNETTHDKTTHIKTASSLERKITFPKQETRESQDTKSFLPTKKADFYSLNNVEGSNMNSDAPQSTQCLTSNADKKMHETAVDSRQEARGSVESHTLPRTRE